MKKAFFLMCFVAITVTALAQRKNETKDPFIGTWKFSSKTVVNDFQKLFVHKRDYPIEYFTFEANHTFKHDFYDGKKNLVKTLNGKWKSVGDLIQIKYSTIEVELLTHYFFIDKDLVLGQNFSHVIFTRENTDYNVVLK